MTPYASAQTAYMKDQAKNSTYVANSLVLTLGGIQGGVPTSTKVPNPVALASVTGKEAEGYYLSDTDVSYNGSSYVFGAVGKRVSLCTVDNFSTNVGGIPYQVPAAVQAKATQRFQDQGKTWTVDYAACACAGSLEPDRPSPGALTISFPDGAPIEFSNPGDVVGNPGMAGATMDLYTSQDGDFIVESGSSLIAYSDPTIPWTATPNAAECAKLAIYDFFRCGRTKVNIQEAVDMMGKPFNGQGADVLWRCIDPENPPALLTLGNIPRGIMHIYTIAPDGTIGYRSIEIQPSPYTCAGEGQLYAEVQESTAFPSATKTWKLNGIKYPDSLGNLQTGNIQGLGTYDVYVRDQSRNIGGGQHSGDRMDGNPKISLYSSRRHDFGQGNERSFSDYGSGDRAGGEYGNHYGNHNGHHNNNMGGYYGNNSNHGGSYNNSHNSGSSNGIHTGSHASATGVAGSTGTTGSGEGIPPMITRQDDFASSNLPKPAYVSYTFGNAPGQPRPAYTKNGLAADIRFRRQIDAGDLDFLIGGHDLGYIGEMW